MIEDQITTLRPYDARYTGDHRSFFGRDPAAGRHAGQARRLGPLPDDIRVYLDAGYDFQVARDELAARGMTGQIAGKADKAPIQAGQRWHAERASAWHDASGRLRRCCERHQNVTGAFSGLAGAISTSTQPDPPATGLLPIRRPPGAATVITDLSPRALS